ncbi:MAG: hypothetical protein HZA19_00495 [Nitrospirae bacterium]|nr:hypothetical protein [Nitrospirota bacterium]
MSSVLSANSCALHEFLGGRYKEIRAYIDRNPNWKIVENCGYENCQPMVDFLTGENITAKIEFFKDNKNLFFDILLNFTNVNETFEFNTESIFVRLGNGMNLNPKVFRCGKTKEEIDYLLQPAHSERDLLRLKPSLQGSISIMNLDCFRLFFDYPPPSIEEEIVMNINSALTLKGKPIEVPLIHFRKNPKLK